MENETAFFYLLRLSLPPEVDEMTQIFMSKLEGLALLKCLAVGLSTTFLME